MLKKFNLQMFAEDAGMADAGLATGSDDAGTVDAGASTTDTADGAPEETFDSLIKGKYKADYDASVKKAIEKRFKNQKDLEGRLNSFAPALSMMAERYGIDAADFGKLDADALTKAIESDVSMYEQEAYEKGMDVKTLMQQKTLERENRQLKALRDRQEQEERNRQEYEAMLQEAAAVQQVYPDFNFDTEMGNEFFGRTLVALAKSGAKDPMRTAYEVVHKDEILAAGMQYAVQQTAQKVANSVRSGRPTENGVAKQAPASSVANKDPRTFKREDFDRLRRAAERGERITLL